MTLKGDNMRKLLLAILIISPLTCYSADVKTKPYIRKNGTYVKDSVKTKPNRTKADNYSTKGNSNPYSGIKGTKKGY